MEYKGYLGKVEYDDEAGIFHGEVVNLRDVITFAGESVAELRQAFEESVDDYLAFCAARSEAPETPYAGILAVSEEEDVIDWREYIAADPQVMVGKPLVRGTRITVELILEKLAAGETVDDLLVAYPRLSRAAIQAALAYAAEAPR